MIIKRERNLLEAYKSRLAISEKVYNREHGDTFTESKKSTVAACLNNISKFLTERFDNSVGTQRADLGTFKKFTMDITTVALPNLIAHELVLVRPMTSMTGYVQYIKFIAGSNKGGVRQGDVFNDPFKLGAMTDDRVNYTASAVVEEVTLDGEGAATLAWTPLNAGFVPQVVNGESGVTVEVVDAEAGKIKVTGASGTVKVKYLYDNVVIPQNDLPVYNAKMEGIALKAKARRISIYYSQIAAFQAKQELGLDLGQVLSEQACGELTYEVDTEVVKLLDEITPTDVTVEFNKTVPTGISLKQHYEGFVETLEKGSQIIYDRTQKHSANYMVCASNVKTVLALTTGWKAANTSKINGPYFAGTINGLKVFVSPALAPGRFILGFNGDELSTSAALWAPYMPLIPTQALGFADGGISQGFATLYDLVPLNPMLLVAGEIVEKPQPIIVQQ